MDTPGRLRTAMPWLAGVAVGALVLGPALLPGSLLNLDLVFTPTIPVPRGVWGLGPELSRRVPLGVVLAWLSRVVGGPAAGKLLLGAALVVAFAGMWRLLPDAGILARTGAALLYTVSPFTLTRVAVGHWGVVAAMAVLPWALATLLRPNNDMRRTWLWSVAIGATGITGGTIGAVLVVVGLSADRGRRAARVLAVFLTAQLPWVLPGLFTVSSVSKLSNPRHFATDVPLPWGLLRLVAGGGFWRAPSQVAGRGIGAALLGAALLVFAAFGWRRLPSAWRGRAAAAAGVGLALALASGLPGVRSVFAHVTSTTLGASLRDSQRLLALFLVWLAAAAALGAARLGANAGPALEPTVAALPAAAAAVLAAPGLWGANGALEPVTFPGGWSQARAHVDARPGPVLALPWHEYLNLRFAADRRVLNPVPDYFGGDVLASSDPEFADSPHAMEQGDPRERHVPPLLDHLDRASGSFAQLGIRWVVVLHEVDWQKYAALNDDGGLERTLSTSALDLYRVRAWRGPVVDEHGRVLNAHTVLQPWTQVPPSGPATATRPGASGWLRGTSSATTTAAGLLGLPHGRGPVWYWPAVVVLVGDVIVVGGVAWAVVRKKGALLDGRLPD